MARGSDPAVTRWRAARAARKQAYARLAEAEVDAGVREGLTRSVRLTLAVVAVLAVVLAGLAVWQAQERGNGYSDAELVDAATARVQVLLTADADNENRVRQILAGAAGEFYAEGFVVAVAVGWWMILWTLLGAAALARLKREKQNAVPDGPERRDAMGKRDFRRAPGVSP